MGSGQFITPVSNKAAKVAPAASSQVIFVQFADGSTCGDANDGPVSLMETRADLLLALKKLDNAAKMGESKFLNALAEKQTDKTGNAQGILNDISEMQKERGSAAVIEHIRSMLDVAAAAKFSSALSKPIRHIASDSPSCLPYKITLLQKR
jgi:hypothetical protein